MEVLAMEKIYLNMSVLELIMWVAQQKFGLKTGDVWLDELYQILVCREKNDYSPMQETDLYKNRGTAYCIMLEAIEDALDGKQLVVGNFSVEKMEVNNMKKLHQQQLQAWLDTHNTGSYGNIYVMDDECVNTKNSDIIGICFEESSSDYDSWENGWLDELKEQIENMGYGWEWYNSIELHIYPLY